MGSVDGPGIRSVVFFQGCSLRCAFCHNPDTWGTEPNKVITTADLIKKILRFKPYYDSSGGGVTFSGGEPLLQPEFLLDILKKCKQNNIHTALDTSGVGHKGDKKFRPDYKEILKYTDLVLLDVKHTRSEMYKMCIRDRLRAERLWPQEMPYHTVQDSPLSNAEFFELRFEYMYHHQN